MPDAPRPFQAVLFDLDNTLYDREAAFGRWADAYLRDTLRLTDPEEATRVRALIFNLDANGYGSKAAIFERLHSLYPTLPGGSARSVDIFFDEFLAHITPEAETEALLDALADARLPFGVITNGSARQWRKIENLGLARRTDCLFVSETFGGKKPGRAIFDAAAVHLGIPPAQILFVGDNPTVDVLGAQTSGMKAAWLHRGQPWPEELAGQPDFVIGSLGELAGILGLPQKYHSAENSLAV
jgi:putative hydrolase of the HAD superfamily